MAAVCFQEQSLYSGTSTAVTLPAEVDGLVLEKEGSSKVIVRATSIGLTLHYSKVS